MKLEVVIILATVYLSLGVGSDISLVPGDNSHYVEGVSRYIWMPDGDGVPHLVDLEAPIEDVARISRSGENNEYWLYTRKNPTEYQLLINGRLDSIRNSNYDGSKPLMVIVHGYLSKGTSSLNPNITGEYLRVADANVIVVDWRDAANSLYGTAVRAVPGIGNHLGRFLRWLFESSGGDYGTLHLVGFSLGAHVVGNAGRPLGRRAGRITGLDPAGPQWTHNSQALIRFDGRYVEGIHTDGGVLGILNPIGTADFYPNGGTNPQPGCLISTCSHSRAYKLFAASVRYNRHLARWCGTLQDAKTGHCRGGTTRMGNSINNKTALGLHAIITGRNWPFRTNSRT